MILNIQVKAYKDFPAILEAVKDFNEGILNLSLVDNLIQLAPNTSELSNIQELEKSGKKLNFDIAENYSYHLNQIPQVSKKLKVIKSMFTFEEDLPDIKLYLERVKKSIFEIKNSQELKTILGYSLKWGNILNVGTSREKAKGFDFKILLNNLPTDDQKREGLVYLTEKIFEKNPQFGPLQTKFPNSFSWLITTKQEGNTFKADALMSYFRESKKMLDQLFQENVNLKSLDDSYQEKIKERLSADVKQARELIVEYDQIKNELMDLAVYYSALTRKPKEKEDEDLNDAELFIFNLKQFEHKTI